MRSRVPPELSWPLSSPAPASWQTRLIRGWRQRYDGGREDDDHHDSFAGDDHRFAWT